MTLEEFVRRWCLHIQPTQLTKTRYLGGWSNAHRAAYTADCRDRLRQLNPPSEANSPNELNRSSEAEPPEPLAAVAEHRDHDPLVCRHCGSDRLVLIEETRQPSWREILDSQSESCPAWYAELKRADDRRFWDGLMGEGFNDWYLEAVVESAKEPPPQSPPPVQLYLPGILPGQGFLLDSF